MATHSNKNFWRFITTVSILVAIVFIALVVKLFDRGSVIFTDDENGAKTPELTRKDPILGASSPKVVIVYFGDYACQSCSKLSNSLENIVEDFEGEVTVVWKDFPNTSLNSESMNAAVAAQCAHEQNKFWEYHSLLMSHQSELGNDLYVAAMKEVGLKEGKFTRCIKANRPEDEIKASLDQVTDLNLTVAPTLFINGERYTGQISQAELAQIVRDIIEE